MLPRFLPLAALLAVSASGAFAPIAHAQLVQKRTLPNGLTVLVQENHAAPVVAVRIYVKTGSIYEDRYLGSGLSHLFEHTLFEGTKTRDKKQLNDELQAIGGQSNAYTSYDVTAYHVTTAAPYFGRALAVLADMTQNATFPEAEVTTQQGVIHSEMGLGEDDPADALGELFDSTAFRVHPTRYPIIGFREQFDRLTQADIASYYRSHYTPGNSVLSVAGDVSAAGVFAAAEREFGGWERAAPQALALPQEPLQTSPRRAVVEKDVSLAYLRMGWHTVPLQSPDLYALDTLAQILGGNELSPLVKQIRDTGLASDISAYSSTPNYDAGIFGITATLPPGNITKVERAVKLEVEKIKNQGVSEAELSRAKRQIRSSFIFSKQGVENQAEQNAFDELGTGDPTYSTRYVNRIQQVTAAQVQAVAQKYLYPDGLTTAIVKPRAKKIAATSAAMPSAAGLPAPASAESANGFKSTGARNTDLKIAVVNQLLAAQKKQSDKAPETLAEVQSGGKFAPEMFEDENGQPFLYDAEAGKVSRDPQSDVKANLDETAKLAAGPVASGAAAKTPRKGNPAPRPAPPKIVKLPNGVTLILRPNNAAPTVAMTVTGLGGVRLEAANQSGYSSLTAAMLTRGTRRRSADGIAQILGDLGGDMSGFSGYNSWGITGSFLSQDWRRGLNLLAESTLAPTFPGAELRKIQAQTLDAIAAQDDDPMNSASLLLRKTFYGNHPYGRSPLGSAASVKAASSAGLAAFWKRVLQPKNTIVSIAGRFDANQVEAVARQLFGSFEAAGAPLASPGPVAFPPSFALAERAKAGAAQTALWFGFPSIDVKGKDRYALDVLDAALSGADLPGGRLHERLRNSQLVYVTHAYDAPGLGGGMFVVYAATEPKNRAEVRRVIEEELQKVRDAEISPAELERAKTMMISSHAIDLQTNDEQARDLATNQLFGLGADEGAGYAAQINKITAADVQRAAQKYLRMENAALAVVGPA